jgi:hypothetical protein
MYKIWEQRNLAIWLPIVFGSKTYLWMKKYNIVVIVFSFNFEGEMNFNSIMCIWKKMCLKEIWIHFWCFELLCSF